MIDLQTQVDKINALLESLYANIVKIYMEIFKSC
jgi:hypothetical protein